MKIKLYFSLFILTLFFYSCEKNTYFQSEKKVAEKIQKRWELIRVAENQPVEDWIFSAGKVYRVSTASGIHDTVDIGDYSINTTLSDAFVTISNFKDQIYHLNSKYTIDQLNEEVFAIIGNDEVNQGGTLYKEFTIQK